MIPLYNYNIDMQKESGDPATPTWVHEIFQGVLVNETRCLSCETVRSKDEDFLDLSVDVEQNTSLTQCLRCGREGGRGGGTLPRQICILTFVYMYYYSSSHGFTSSTCMYLIL